MDVFSFALQKRAVKLIMVHNHPSGELKSSKEDIAITERMMAIDKFIRVPVMDHLIITEKGYLSFDDELMIAEMEKANKFDLSFKEHETESFSASIFFAISTIFFFISAVFFLSSFFISSFTLSQKW